MLYLIFFGGVMIGVISSYVILDRTSAHGYFIVVPYTDEEVSIDGGFYSVKVSLQKDMNIVNKNRIILHKSDSHK